MLSAAIGPRFNRFPCYVQPKLNGVRALYQNGVFQSRDEKIWTFGVLHHLHMELSTFVPNDLILDGELYRHGWRLQRINGAVAVNRLTPRDDTHEVCFHVFDVVNPDEPFSRRWFEIYSGLVAAELPHIKAVPTTFVQDRDEMRRAFELYVSEGYEGIMLRPDGPYTFGEKYSERAGHNTRYNSPYLWKHKAWEDGEFKCIGAIQGEGKADIGVGALMLLVGDGPYVFNVGTGFSDEDRVELWNNAPIGKLVRVRYPYLSEDGVPQCPSFVAVM
jgi:DNA ligase-1